MPKVAEDVDSYDDEVDIGQQYDRHRYRDQQHEGQQFDGQRYEEDWYTGGRCNAERQDSLTGVSSGSALRQPSFLGPPSNLLLPANLLHPLGPTGDRWDDSQRDGYGGIAVDSVVPLTQPLETFAPPATSVPHPNGANGKETTPSPASTTLSALPPPPPSDCSSPTAFTPVYNPLTPTTAVTSPAEPIPSCESHSSELAQSTTSLKPSSQPSRPWTPQTQPSLPSTSMEGAPRPEAAGASVWTRTNPSGLDYHGRSLTPTAVSNQPDPTPISPSPLGRESPTPPNPIVVRGTPQELPRKAPTPGSPPTPPHLCFGGEAPTSPEPSLPVVEEPAQEEPPPTEPVPRAY